MKKREILLLTGTLLLGTGSIISPVNADNVNKNVHRISVRNTKESNEVVKFDNTTLNDAILLNLKQSNIIDENADSFTESDIGKLTVLNFNGIEFTDLNKEDINKLDKYMVNVKSLNIDNSTFPDSFNLSKFSRSLPQLSIRLEKINVTNSHLTDKNLKNNEQELTTLDQVKELNLSGNDLSSLSFIAGYNIPKLLDVNFSYNDITSLNSTNDNLVDQFKVLEQLDLSHNKLRSLDGVQDYNFPSLEVVHFDFNDLTNVSLKTNKTVKFGSLEELYLNNNNIDNLDGLAQFKFPELTYVDFSSNELTQFEQLRKSYSNFPNLNKFNGNDNKISDFSPMTVIDNLNTSSSAKDQQLKVETSFNKPTDDNYHVFEIDSPIVPVSLGSGKVEVADGNAVSYSVPNGTEPDSDNPIVYNPKTSKFLIYANRFNLGSQTISFKMLYGQISGTIDLKNTWKSSNEISNGIVDVKYEDVNKNLLDSVSLTGSIGANYKTTRKTFPGYKFQKVIGNANGQFTEQPQNVTYIYKKAGDEQANNLDHYGDIRTGTAVSGTKHIYMYKNMVFKKNERDFSYAKKPIINRPMFIVERIVKNKNGRVRLYVKDVNHKSTTSGRHGFITAENSYVSPAYYQGTSKTITVINPQGVNGYKNKNLSKKVKHYKQGSVIKVDGIAKHNLTTRFKTSDGQYITANRKLVHKGVEKVTKLIKVKKNIKLYRNAELTQRDKKRTTFKKGTRVVVKKFVYSHPNVMNIGGAKRYLVANGYVTANREFVSSVYRK